MAEEKRKPGRPKGSKNKSSAQNNSSKPKSKQKVEEVQAQRKADKRVIDEIWAIVAMSIGAFLIIATISNGAGKFGEAVSVILKGTFGFMAYVLPFYLIVFGILLFAKKTSHFNLKTILLLFLMLIMMCMLYSVHFVELPVVWSWDLLKVFYQTGTTMVSGGLLGMAFATLFVNWLGNAGCWILGLAVILACILLVINTPLSRGFQKLGDKIEEKKLSKQFAHLDEVPDRDNAETVKVNYQTQMPMTDASHEQSQQKPQKKREIKIVNGSNDDQTGTTINGDALNQKSITQNTNASIAIAQAQADLSGLKKKSNVIDFMKSDDMFGAPSSNNSGKYGLEESGHGGYGYGLDGNSYNGPQDYNLGFEVETISVLDNPYDEPKKDGIKIQSDISTEIGDDKKSHEDSSDKPDKISDKGLTKKEASEAMLKTSEINSDVVVKKYKLPPVNLLEKPVSGSRISSASLQANAEKLESTLKSFNVDASVNKVIQGPTVTRYEVQPAVGVKVSKIVSLADDIALNLEAKSIRIEAPIPGKAAVGIEIENEKSTMVRLREVIDSNEFKTAKSKITFAVGKDISGNIITADLKSMPHMLIGGSTGSGKSVCINSIITSLLYKANPDEVKMILIDPKVVELGGYNGIPHLLIPVVTDPAKAAAALNWAVAEMNERYEKFALEGVRDLESYNEYVTANAEYNKIMPQVVIIIDELADLMMACSTQVQDSICRIAQKARACGMHLIVATQRPSVDVITGVIKANIPSRISFAVSSYHDSMTILDEKGAETLVGKGDMLFAPIGISKPLRVQGTFVSDDEVKKVIDYVKEQSSSESNQYDQDVLEKISRTGDSEQQSQMDDEDELLSDCIELVVHQQQASVSMLQRRFRIGYNRAARIIDMIEARGIIGPQDGSRARQVLITEEEYNNILNDPYTMPDDEE